MSDSSHPLDLASRLLYRDGDVLVVDKPMGWAVHGGTGRGESLHPLLETLRFGRTQPPELAHRLDRETSGCLVLGRHRRALARLGSLFASGGIDKTYWAVVVGCPAETEGTITLPLRKLERRFGWMVVVDAKAGQEATTHWTVRGKSGRLSWLELHPRTGRTHQIRVHLAALGHPIVGDRLYGRGTADLVADRLHLLARQVVIPYGERQPPCVVTAPPPDHMRDNLAACGYRDEPS